MDDDLCDGLKEEVEENVRAFFNLGWAPWKVLTEALVAGMRSIGVDFRDGILFVPEGLLAANSMKAGMSILKPLLAESGGPLNEEFANAICADAGCRDAAVAVETAKRFMEWRHNWPPAV